MKTVLWLRFLTMNCSWEPNLPFASCSYSAEWTSLATSLLKHVQRASTRSLKTPLPSSSLSLLSGSCHSLTHHQRHWHKVQLSCCFDSLLSTARVFYKREVEVLGLTVGRCGAGCSSMWKAALVFYHLLAFGWPLWAQEDVADAAITPQDCSMDCIRQVSWVLHLAHI